MNKQRCLLSSSEEPIGNERKGVSLGAKIAKLKFGQRQKFKSGSPQTQPKAHYRIVKTDTVSLPFLVAPEELAI